MVSSSSDAKNEALESQDGDQKKAQTRFSTAWPGNGNQDQRSQDHQELAHLLVFLSHTFCFLYCLRFTSLAVAIFVSKPICNFFH